MKFKTSENLPIVLEEHMEYTSHCYYTQQKKQIDQNITLFRSIAMLCRIDNIM
jgi:hypothetical protein